MGTDDLFKKRRARRLAEREAGKRLPKPDSFLIITEGEKTEPNYFSGLAKHINDKVNSNSIEVKTPVITTQGEGKCTVSLVNEAVKIAARSPIIHSQTWILFDKDDFEDFDEAVELCQKLNYYAGWSNQAFEYWLYLHFEYSETAFHRTVLFQKLNQLFKDRGICASGYNKNDELIFEHVTAKGGLKNALRNAEKIDQKYDDNQLPSKCDPCTKVYILIKELEQWLQDLL